METTPRYNYCYNIGDSAPFVQGNTPPMLTAGAKLSTGANYDLPVACVENVDNYIFMRLGNCLEERTWG
jgi:hypothetical protein